ncbi:hypothetical protein EWE75_14445 [Sphingomonas populi]|uniref:Uncharacterized protein n=1 Tax=Sphingomonas populi TaxID=2484750 RepID=A0A4Q6Y3E5_9SPHN|nr:hypothetical protein [Sphingomonas populi]RZF63827.1 hypothetical protein EWE75_14445 [Sphingomonas populi]
MNLDLFSGAGNVTPERTGKPNLYRTGEIKSASMSLSFIATGEIGTAAVQALAARLNYDAGVRGAPSKKYVAAVGATINDLLRAASYDPVRACSRPLSSGSFSDRVVGYRPFVRVLDDLVAQRYIGIDKGYHDSSDPYASYVTRVWATSKLFNYLAGLHVTPSNRAEHFARVQQSIDPTSIIRLKGTKPTREGKYEFEAPAVPVNINDAAVAALAEPVRTLNAFLFAQVIDGGEFDGLYRSFNLGDHPAFAWNMGGRLYNANGGYQQDAKDVRSGITFNRMPTVEIDITASHLTILHGLMGVQLPAGDDPYAATGLPREIAKAWVAMTLGHDDYHANWTPKVSGRLKGNELLNGKSLQKAFPIAKVQELVLRKLPVLQGWDGNPIKWADLQFIESEIILATMLKLMKFCNAPSLPVHDSLIIPKDNTEMGTAFLKYCFKKKVGVDPYVKIK